MTLAIDDFAQLNAGWRMPRLGLGVFRAGAETYDAVMAALQVGYRHIDTAAVYGNEADVGRAVVDSGVPRDKVFVTTKLWNDDHGFDEAQKAFDASLARLGLDYVDLYLIHWPVPEKRLDSWRALERIHASGRARAIGVSNYMAHHLRELLDFAAVRPGVDQFELHPYNYRSRRATVDLCKQLGIVIETYSPLTKGRRLLDPPLVAISEEVARTPAQVLIRWALQKGFVVIPKSSNPHRILENCTVFDFELTEAQMERLDALDEGLATAWDPTRAP